MLPCENASQEQLPPIVLTLVEDQFHWCVESSVGQNTLQGHANRYRSCVGTVYSLLQGSATVGQPDAQEVRPLGWRKGEQPPNLLIERTFTFPAQRVQLFYITSLLCHRVYTTAPRSPATCLSFLKLVGVFRLPSTEYGSPARMSWGRRIAPARVNSIARAAQGHPAPGAGQRDPRADAVAIGEYHTLNARLRPRDMRDPPLNVSRRSGATKPSPRVPMAITSNGSLRAIGTGFVQYHTAAVRVSARQN